MADPNIPSSRLRTSAKDLTAKRFGKLTPVAPTLQREQGYIVWNCRCDCGTYTMVSARLLKSGNTKSCGCLKRVADRPKRYGTARSGVNTPEWQAWHNMLARCFNPQHPSFRHYGGRGITVCDRWRCFESFLEDIGPRPNGLTLERVNNSLGYSPENCKWATRSEQQRNQRRGPRKAK